MKPITLVTFVLSFILSAQAFGSDIIYTDLKLPEGRSCTSWDLEERELKKDHVTVTLTDVIRVCHLDSKYIYEFHAVGTVLKTSIHQIVIVAFAAGSGKKDCKSKLSMQNYREELELMDNSSTRTDLLAKGSSLRYDTAKTVCARLYFSDSKTP